MGPVTPLHEKFAGCHVGIKEGRNLKKKKKYIYIYKRGISVLTL